MLTSSVRLVLWNIAWRKLSGAAGAEIWRRIDDLSPDIICITEGHLDFLPDSGHLISSHPDYGYPIKAGRRKVLLWSRSPWTQLDQTGDPEMPSGRFVGGVTETNAGPLRVLGVCIPWSHAHVTSGRKDRRTWEDHQAYIEGMARLIPRQAQLERTIIAGDFNQTIPRTRAPKDVYAALTDALSDRFTVATTGTITPLEKPAIDHVAHTHDLRIDGIEGISNIGPNDKALSDHFGLCVDVQVA